MKRLLILSAILVGVLVGCDYQKNYHVIDAGASVPATKAEGDSGEVIAPSGGDPAPQECAQEGEDCTEDSECCLGQCHFIASLNRSTCGLEPPPSPTGGGTNGCTADQDCSDPVTQMCDLASGQCVPRRQPVPAPLPVPNPVIVPLPEVAPLEVVSHSPEGDSSDQVIKITFSKGVKSDSLVRAFSISQTAFHGGNFNVTGKISLDNYDLTATHFVFIPDKPLQAGQEYCYLIQGGAAPQGVEGTDGSTITEGNNLKDSRPGWRPVYSWCFVVKSATSFVEEPATCHDTIWNANEGDIDCGGSCIKKCESSRFCKADSDCVSNACSTGMINQCF